MFFQALVHLAHTLNVDIPMAPAKVEIVLDLDEAGSVVIARKPESEWMLVPKVNRVNNSDIKPDFLCGRMDRLIGLSRDESNIAEITDSNVRKTFQATIALAQQASAEVPLLLPIKKFYDQLVASRAHVISEIEKVLPVIKNKGNPTILLDTGGLLDDSDVRDFWVRFVQPESESESAEFDHSEQESLERVPCVICGTRSKPQRIHQAKIKGVPGAAIVGASLVSFNKNSFVNYDMQNATGVPTCSLCVQNYAAALNKLLSQQHVHGQARVTGPGMGSGSYLLYKTTEPKDGGLALVYWTSDGTANPIEAIIDGSENLHQVSGADMYNLLSAPSTGGRLPVDGRQLDSAYLNNLYMLILAGNKGRIAVVDHAVWAVERVWNNVFRHFQRLSMTPRCPGQVVRRLSLLGLSKVTSTPQQKIHSDLFIRYLRAALFGEKLPIVLMHMALASLRKELRKAGIGGMTPESLGLLRGVHNDHAQKECLSMNECLDQEQSDPAYNAGRLLAIFHRLQDKAIGAPKASVVSRNFGSACTRPRTGLTVPIHLHVHHLKKLNPVERIYFQNCLLSVFRHLNVESLPSFFNSAQQVRFTIGFYHQVAWFEHNTNHQD